MRKQRVAIVGAALVTVAAAAGGFLWFRAREQARLREGHTVAEAMHRVTRLATVEMTVSDWRLRRDEKALFGLLPIKCRKTVAVFYRGKVAAGFDLDAGTALSVDAVRRHVDVHLPAARLLYVDVPPPEVVVADGSVCNQVTAEDYSRLAGDARQAIEGQALASGILGKAEEHARALLAEVARPLGYELAASFGPSAPIADLSRR